jgi:multidrug efflux pump subunit AcrA (membrane-fusion protein)
MTARRWLRVAAGCAVIAAIVGAAWAGTNLFRRARASSELPVAAARKGEFLVIIRCRGDVKAGRSVPIYAPIVPNLTIAWMAPAGEQVQEGLPVIRFDSSSAQQQLAQKEAALKQAQASLDQALAQSEVTSQQDRSDLKDAQYNVEKARLQTLGNEFVGRIQAEQAQIDFGLADEKLKVQQANVDLHSTSDKAKIASLKRQRDQAQADVDLTKSRIAQMEIRAPITGFLVIAPNYNQGPLNGNPFKVGDNVYSGMNLAEMPDMTSLVMDAKAEEIDRGHIAVGNDVRLRIDALPELSIPARITAISPLTELGVEWPPTRSFRAYAAVNQPDTRLRPGMNGGMDVVVNRLPDAISIPAKAVFTRSGKPVVFVADHGKYSRVDVQLLARNPDDVAVTGVAPGSLVTLVDPEKTDKPKS